MEKNNNIGPILKKQGRSIKWLAEQLKKSRYMTERYINGKSDVSAYVVKEAAMLLNVTMDELMIDPYNNAEEKDNKRV